MVLKKIIILLVLLGTLPFLKLNTYASEEDVIVGPDVIYKEASRVLTLSTILPLYESIAGNVTVKTDNYTGFGDKPGIYQINLTVDDTIFKMVDISVRQKIGNVIAVTQTDDQYRIILHKNNILTNNDIIDVLVNVQMITYTSTTEIFILTDTYTENNESPGLYAFEFHLANAAGYEETFIVEIQVNNTEKLTPDIQVERMNYQQLILNTLYTLGSIALFIGALYLIAKLNKRAKRKGGLL
jgi:hypothetical protein